MRAEEDEDAKEEDAALTATFEPLAAYLKKELSDSINEGKIDASLALL